MPIDDQLNALDAELLPLINQPDQINELIALLQRKYPPPQAAGGTGLQAWDYSGLVLSSRRRFHEALQVHWEHYQHLLQGQQAGSRVHKGTPLVRIGDCYGYLGYRVHALRYLMLTLCEDAVQDKGTISAKTAGVYFRLILGGVTDGKMQEYAQQVFKRAGDFLDEALFPEALLQSLDDDWLTTLPSEAEALVYRINPKYVEHLLSKLGDKTGETLEKLAKYLMSCMAGCRVRTRAKSNSTDYDVVCAMEGFDIDFRSELGRHFVCECKDWKNPADFTVIAKFCRVLDSTKSCFGILFSSKGITGVAKTTAAAREQLKLFQDRGIVIVVLSRDDLDKVAQGANLIALLRNKYEAVRLDLA
jgi:hypothetical protein